MKATNLIKRVGATVLAAALAASVLATGAFAVETETPEATTNTLHITKYTGAGEGVTADGTEAEVNADDWTAVEGAEFTLFTPNLAETDAVKEINMNEGKYMITDWGNSDGIVYDDPTAYVVVTASKIIQNPNSDQPNSLVLDTTDTKTIQVPLTATTKEATTGADGTADITGIEDGIYVLIETKNPTEGASVNSFIQLPYGPNELKEVYIYPKDDTNTPEGTNKTAVAVGTAAITKYNKDHELGLSEADIAKMDALWMITYDLSDNAKYMKDSANYGEDGTATDEWTTYGGYQIVDTPTGASIVTGKAFYSKDIDKPTMGAALTTEGGWDLTKMTEGTIQTTQYPKTVSFAKGDTGFTKPLTLDLTADPITAKDFADYTTKPAVADIAAHAADDKYVVYFVGTKADANAADPSNKATTSQVDPDGNTTKEESGDKKYPGLKITILKIDGETKAPLQNAKFNFVDAKNNFLASDGIMYAEDATLPTGVTKVEVTSNADGLATTTVPLPTELMTALKGADGYLMAKETAAPTGYQAKTLPIVLKSEKVPGSDENVPSFTTTGTVNNFKEGTTDPENPTFQLPLTGGMGTTLFTVLGVVIMGCAVFFFYRSRKKNEQ